SEPECSLHHFGARTAKPDAFGARDVSTNLPAQLDLQPMLAGKEDPQLHLLTYALQDCSGCMTQQVGTLTEAKVDVAVAVHIPEVSSLGPFVKGRMRRRCPKLAADASRQIVGGFDKHLARDRV